MSRSGSSLVACSPDRRRRAPAANSGKPEIPCIDTISESRPNSVTNHGTPAAGMNTPRSNVGSSRRNDSRSRTAWSQARSTTWFGVWMATFGSVVRPILRSGASTALHASVTSRRCAPVTGSHFRQVCHDPFGGSVGHEDQAAVGELGRRPCALDGDDEVPTEIAVHVGRAELAAGAEPARVDLAAPEDLAPPSRRRCRRSPTGSRSRSSAARGGVRSS